MAGELKSCRLCEWCSTAFSAVRVVLYGVDPQNSGSRDVCVAHEAGHLARRILQRDVERLHAAARGAEEPRLPVARPRRVVRRGTEVPRPAPLVNSKASVQPY